MFLENISTQFQSTNFPKFSSTLLTWTGKEMSLTVLPIPIKTIAISPAPPSSSYNTAWLLFQADNRPILLPVNIPGCCSPDTSHTLSVPEWRITRTFFIVNQQSTVYCLSKKRRRVGSAVYYELPLMPGIHHSRLLSSWKQLHCILQKALFSYSPR